MRRTSSQSQSLLLTFPLLRCKIWVQSYSIRSAIKLNACQNCTKKRFSLGERKTNIMSFRWKIDNWNRFWYWRPMMQRDKKIILKKLRTCGKIQNNSPKPVFPPIYNMLSKRLDFHNETKHNTTIIIIINAVLYRVAGRLASTVPRTAITRIIRLKHGASSLERLRGRWTIGHVTYVRTVTSNNIVSNDGNKHNEIKTLRRSSRAPSYTETLSKRLLQRLSVFWNARTTV